MNNFKWKHRWTKVKKIMGENLLSAQLGAVLLKPAGAQRPQRTQGAQGPLVAQLGTHGAH